MTEFILTSFAVTAIALFALYFIVAAAVAEGMKRHTRWQVANRDEIEAKYAKRLDPGNPSTP